MAIEAFPPVELADENGLLAIGGDLEVESLLLAYSQGIFPWPVFDEDVLAWFCPPERTLLFLNDVHISKSLKKKAARAEHEIRVNTAFEVVVRKCAELRNRGTQGGTWITEEIVVGYLGFHRAGFAHSIECWQEDELVGGLYGVALGGMFAGESMFYRVPDASKICLLFLINYMQQHGLSWIDCQQSTPLLDSFGAKELPRQEFLRLLKKELDRKITLFKEF